MNKKTKLILCLLTMLVVLPGCWGDPPLHPVTGKITLNGKGYNRLKVYLRSIETKKSKFHIGVGETDPQGNIKIFCMAGKEGLAVGKYRATFSCVVPKSKRARKTLKADEKADDDPNVKLVELVPDPYARKLDSTQQSPVEFEVDAGENVFNFDIPAK